MKRTTSKKKPAALAATAVLVLAMTACTNSGNPSQGLTSQTGQSGVVLGTSENPLEQSGAVSDAIIEDNFIEEKSNGTYKYKVYEHHVEILKYIGSDSEVAIPSQIDGKNVTEIGYDAFSGCTGLSSITIPDSVTKIGAWAFSGCNNLSSITISDSVTYIGTGAFHETKWYENQPDGIVYAGKVAYKYKGEMPKDTNIELKDGTKGIADVAFSDCDNLSSITIPDSVTEIGEDAFSGCTSLSSITIPDSVTKIGEGAFFDCDNLSSITIPDNVTEIGNFAFSDCDNLSSITIPDSVTEIGEDAFSGCTSLSSITIPDSVTEIGAFAFFDCYNLSSVTIPDSVTKIGECAFFDCDNLSSITIPNSVTEIGYKAFEDCKDLTIHAKLGSYAQAYANENDIPFSAI